MNLNQKKKYLLFMVIIMILGIMVGCTIENKNVKTNSKKIIEDSKNNNLEAEEEKNSNTKNDSSTKNEDSENENSEDEINEELINLEIDDSNKNTESVSKEVSDNVTKNEDMKEDTISKPEENKKTEEKSSVSEKYVTLGDSEKDVMKKLGNPRNSNYDGRVKTMYYGKSEIYLAKVNNDFKVVGWNNRGDLKVSLGDKDIKAPPFTYGSSMEEVAKAMGTPYYIIAPYRDTHTYWAYNGDVRVDFKNNKVICWSEGNGELNVSLGEKKLNAAPIEINSTLAEVVEAMGTPDVFWSFNVEVFDEIRLEYGDSHIYLTGDFKVKSWIDKGNLKIAEISRDPNAPPVTVGSSREDIIKAMGQPDEILEGRYFNYGWRYGESYIGVDKQNIVYGWINKGNLKVSLGEYDADAPPITIGSTLEEVIRAHGTPPEVDRLGILEYGRSRIRFRNGVVERIENIDKNIKVSKTKNYRSTQYFDMNGTVEDVAKAEGAPSYVEKYTSGVEKPLVEWKYTGSKVYFDENGKIVGYNDINKTLDVNIGTADPNAQPFKVGSSKEAVINAMGTPDYILPEGMNPNLSVYWAYDDSVIYFDNNDKVAKFYNKGNLKAVE